MTKTRARWRVVSACAVIASLLLAGCGGTSSSDATAFLNDTVDSFLGDSANVSSVKDAYLTSCPTATLGDMADAFMSNPSWTDFPSITGGTVVELDGDITYDGIPASAVIQFDLSGGNFEAVYLGINGVDQSLIMLSSLLTKMCEATF